MQSAVDSHPLLAPVRSPSASGPRVGGTRTPLQQGAQPVWFLGLRFAGGSRGRHFSF